jgi:hypothetical protein
VCSCGYGGVFADLMMVKRRNLGRFRIHFSPKQSKADSTGLRKGKDMGIWAVPTDLEECKGLFERPSGPIVVSFIAFGYPILCN